MTIDIKGQAHELPFNFRSIKAAAKAVGMTKVGELEKLLNQIGYDNAAKVVSAMLATAGVTATAGEVEAGIEDASFPVRLVEALAAAIGGPKADEVAAVTEAAKSGN